MRVRVLRAPFPRQPAVATQIAQPATLCASHQRRGLMEIPQSHTGFKRHDINSEFVDLSLSKKLDFRIVTVTPDQYNRDLFCFSKGETSVTEVRVEGAAFAHSGFNSRGSTPHLLNKLHSWVDCEFVVSFKLITCIDNWYGFSRIFVPSRSNILLEFRNLGN